MAIPQGAGGGGNKTDAQKREQQRIDDYLYKHYPRKDNPIVDNIDSLRSEQNALKNYSPPPKENTPTGSVGGGWSSSSSGGTTSNRSHSDYFGSDQAYAEAIMAKEASGGTLSDPAAAAAFKAANPHLFGGVGGGTSSGGAEQAPSVGASQADEREALLQMYAEAIQGSTDALNAAEKARWEQQIIAIERAYNKALEDQVTAGRQAYSDKSAAETMINENTYKQNELANVMMEQRGVSSSQQGVGMAQSVHSQANKSRTNVQIAYDDRVASIAQRISSLNLDKSLDIASADSVYGSNIAINEASARADIAGKQFDVGYEDYRSVRDFQNQLQLIDYSVDAEVRGFSEKAGIELNSLVRSYTPGTNEYKVRQGQLGDERSMASYKSNLSVAANAANQANQAKINLEARRQQWADDAYNLIMANEDPNSVQGRALAASLAAEGKRIAALDAASTYVGIGEELDKKESSKAPTTSEQYFSKQYADALGKVASVDPGNLRFVGNAAYDGDKLVATIPNVGGSSYTAKVALDEMYKDGMISGGVRDYITLVLNGKAYNSTWDGRNGTKTYSDIY